MEGWPTFTGVFRVQIRKFLDLPDPDPLVRGTDPDPSITTQKYQEKPLFLGKKIFFVGVFKLTDEKYVTDQEHWY